MFYNEIIILYGVAAGRYPNILDIQQHESNGRGPIAACNAYSGSSFTNHPGTMITKGIPISFTNMVLCREEEVPPSVCVEQFEYNPTDNSQII